MVPGFFVVFSSKFSLMFSLLKLQNVFDIGFHAGCAFLLHLIGHMSVDIQGKGGGCMAQIALNGLDIVSGPDGGHGVAVPLPVTDRFHPNRDDCVNGRSRSIINEPRKKSNGLFVSRKSLNG